MATIERPPGRALRLSELPPASEAPYAGGVPFVVHRRAVTRREDPYPTALILCQRLGVALEDVARLVLAFESLGRGDPFDTLRAARYEALDQTFERLADDREALRAALKLPTLEQTVELDAPLRQAVLEASDALARRWFDHWTRCAAGWQLLRRLAKALRHGAPTIPREIVTEPPGAGALGEGLADRYERWVLLVGTEVDHEAKALNTSYAMADISEDTLARARQSGLEAVALARQLTGAHVHRVRSQSKWALPRDVLKLVDAKHRAVLREATRG